MTGKEVSRWADRAMFSAEPIDGAGQEGGVTPSVYLLDPPKDPLGHIAAACMMYEGKVMRSTDQITDEQRVHYFNEMKRTKLQAPFEFFDLHFMIEGVTRAFTHQMVRQRTAVYAQESMRFAVKEHIHEEVVLPPFLIGVKLPDGEYEPWELYPEQRCLVLWLGALDAINDSYHGMVNNGMPAEDARGILPTNIATRLHYKTNLRNLIEHAGNRLCTQAQFEWRLVLSQLVNALRKGGENLTYKRLVQTGPDAGKVSKFNSYWQYDMLTRDLFKPACFLVGHCPFEAQFDRHCSIRDRVREFAEHGVSSDHWETGARIDRGDTYINIPPIGREEWLLDPSAARIK